MTMELNSPNPLSPSFSYPFSFQYSYVLPCCRFLLSYTDLCPGCHLPLRTQFRDMVQHPSIIDYEEKVMPYLMAGWGCPP